MGNLVKDKRGDLTNQLIELLDGCDPVEILSQLTFKMKLAIFFKQTSIQFGMEYEEMDQGDLAGLDHDTMFKKISFIQRVLFSGKVKHGAKQVDETEILKVVDQLLFNHMSQEHNKESSLIHANRYVVTHNIHPHLVVEYTQLLNKYFFEGKDLEEINEFVEELYLRETSLQMDEVTDEGIVEYFEVKKKYSFLQIFDTEFVDNLNLNTRYFNSVVQFKDKYYVFQPNITFDNYYETMRKIYLFKNNDNHSKFNKLQQVMSEELSVEHFLKLMPHAYSYTNVNYRTNTGSENARNTCEIDFLLEAGDTLFLGEVKGARLFSGDYNENPEAYEKNIEELLEKPYTQAKRFYEELKTNESIKTKDKTFEFSDYKSFVIINITTDYLDEIATQYSNIVSTNEYFVWNLSLADLHQYTYLFNHQADFLNFVYQRKKVIESHPHLKFQDEFIFYGFYVDYNDMSITFVNNPAFENENILFALDDFLEPSNIYISQTMLSDNYIQLPQYEKRSNHLQEIIKCTINSNCNETIKTVRCLLELSGDAESEFFESIDLKWNKIIRNTTNRKMAEGPVLISYFELSDNKDAFTIFTMTKVPEKLPQDLNKRLSIRFGKSAKVNIIQLNSKKEIIDCKSFILSYGIKTHEKSIYDIERCDYLERTNYELVKGIERIKLGAYE